MLVFQLRVFAEPHKADWTRLLPLPDALETLFIAAAGSSSSQRIERLCHHAAFSLLKRKPHSPYQLNAACSVSFWADILRHHEFMIPNWLPKSRHLCKALVLASCSRHAEAACDAHPSPTQAQHDARRPSTGIPARTRGPLARRRERVRTRCPYRDFRLSAATPSWRGDGACASLPAVGAKCYHARTGSRK